MGVALLNLGGIIGSIIISRISDKRGPYPAMGIAMGIAIIFIAAIGMSAPAGTAVVLTVIFSGRVYLRRGTIEHQRNRRNQLSG